MKFNQVNIKWILKITESNQSDKVINIILVIILTKLSLTKLVIPLKNIKNRPSLFSRHQFLELIFSTKTVAPKNH